MKPAAVVLFHNSEKPVDRKAQPILRQWFAKRGVRVLPPSRIADAQAAVALGGDGTLLSAARRAAPAGVPVLGVNLGRLGFLAATDLKGIERILESFLAGKLPISQRLMLEAVLPGGKTQLALNDVVIRSRSAVRVITLAARVDGEYLGTFVGDGLIVATPTGSTAYSLAASGPIVQPEMDLLLLTPVCSHSLTQRPVVLAPESVLEISLDSQGRKEEGLLSLDGQSTFPLKTGDKVVIRKAQVRFHIYSDPRRHYFSILREKMKWGER